METIDDIVREMRVMARVSDNGYCAQFCLEFADRIEAACSGCTQFKRAKKMAKENLCLRKENARLRDALKPVLKIEFGDYPTPWTRFEARGKAPETNFLEGVVQTADGYPFSLIGIDFGGLDGLVEIVNAVGESQRIYNESKVV